MQTNPCKKGTYGVFGTYLGYKKVGRRCLLRAATHHCDSRVQGYKGASGEFECDLRPPCSPRHRAVTPPS
jgi:hypothetical protein